MCFTFSHFLSIVIIVLSLWISFWPKQERDDSIANRRVTLCLAKSSRHILHNVFYFSHFLTTIVVVVFSLWISYWHKQERDDSIAKNRRVTLCLAKSSLHNFHIVFYSSYHNFTIIIVFLSAVPFDPIQEKGDSIPKKSGLSPKNRKGFWRQNRQQEQGLQASLPPIRC